MKKIMLGVLLIIFTVVNVQDVNAKTMPFQYIFEEDKSWTIEFSDKIDTKSVTGDTVYIEYLNEKVKIDVHYSFSEDLTKLTVTPVDSYELGYNMRLVIENVVSTNGVTLDEKTSLEFNYVIEEDIKSPFETLAVK